MNNNTLRCETCGKSHVETPIIEKPLRFCRNVKVVELPQLNTDRRKQDNICLSCLTKEIHQIVGRTVVQIEYEIPPLRAIYHKDYQVETEEEAVALFKEEYPRGRIRKIKGNETSKQRGATLL